MSERKKEWARRGPLGVLLAHHREHEAHHVVMLMLIAAALSLIATILVAGAAGYVAVASRIRHAHTYWFPFAIVGAVAAHVGYTFAYREVAHVGRGVRLGALRAGAIVAAGFGMFSPRGGFAVDIEALQDLGVPPQEARVRVRANRHAALDEAKKLKAAGELTEDGLRDVQNEVQKLTDRFVKSIDDHLKHKEAEVMKV